MLLLIQVLTLAIDDLKQYEKAMDWAMIYFHKERMKTINSIIRDLWRQIYCGNDIDTIEVKTDETTPTASGMLRILSRDDCYGLFNFSLFPFRKKKL